jgi:hypothetical protein
MILSICFKCNYFNLVMLNVAIIVSMEVNLKGKAKYGWPPGSVPFHIENIIYLFCKTT